MIAVISVVLMALVCLMACVVLREQLAAIRNAHERLLDRFMARTLAEYHANTDEPDDEPGDQRVPVLRSPDGLIEIPYDDDSLAAALGDD